MKTPIIDTLFDVYSDTSEYAARVDRHPPIQAAERALYAYVGRRDETEDHVIRLEAEVERRLFRLGFEYAMRLVIECGGGAP